jgi:hypothetical protein
MPGQKQREAEEGYVRHGQNAGRNDEVLFLPGILLRQFYILPENFLIAILDDKDIIEEQCRQHVNGGGKKGGLHGRFEPGMLNGM